MPRHPLVLTVLLIQFLAYVTSDHKNAKARAMPSSTDFVLLLMDPKAVDAMLNGKTKLGRDATAAAGPTGATSKVTFAKKGKYT